MGNPLDEYESECRHGTAYTIISSRYRGIATESTYVVPLDQNFDYWVLKITNEDSKPRRLGVFTYCEMASRWYMPVDLTNLQYSQFIAKAEMTDKMLGMAIEPYIPLLIRVT